MPEAVEITGKNPTLIKAQKRLNSTKECKAEKAYREQSNKDIKYFTGEDQGWGDDTKQSKDTEEGRPTVTLNREAPIVRMICGARPDAEASYTAVEEGDVETQDILNACRKHVESINFWDFLENDWFKWGVIKMRSIVELMPDYNKDVRGEVKFSLQDGHTWYLDPEAKEKDRSDDRFRFRLRTIDPDTAKRMWPDKKGQIDTLTATVKGDIDDVETTTDTDRVEDYEDLKSNYYDTATDKLTIAYYWYKEYSRQTKIVDLIGLDENDEPIVYDAKGSPEKVRKELEAINPEITERFIVISVETIKVKFMVFCHDIILEQGDNPWQRADGQRTYLSDNFPQIIFEPERIHAGARNELVSILNPMHDPQKFHNRLASAILQIIGTAATSGTDYEEGALSPEQEKKLEKYGSKPGVNIKWNKGALSQNQAKPRVPNTIPQAHIQQAKQMADDVLNISGVESLVSTEALGKGASGVAIDLKQRQGGNIVSWLYDSFRFFQHLLALCIKDSIQRLYNYNKVVRITGTKTRYVRINEEIYDYNGAVTEVLNNVTIGDYDVVISDKEVMPTMRMERLKMFFGLIEKGALQLPPSVLQKIVFELLEDPQLKQVVEEEMEAFQKEMQGQPQLQAGMVG